MISWSTNRVNPAVAVRTTMPGQTRQSAAAAPIASRGAFRAAALSRSAPTTTQRADKPDDEDDDEKKPKEAPFGRDDAAPNDDGLDNPDANETDTDPDDEDKGVQIVVVS